MLADDDAFLTLWDLETGMPVTTQGLKPRGWGALHEISPDGNTIAVVSNDGEEEWFIQFWRAPSWEEIGPAEQQSD